VLDFLRDKFTATDLYLFLQKETSALYRKMYEMAHRAADEAQRAFNFERGHTTRRFIPEEIWENLHEGLMAGERLDVALRHMEKEYLDENVREYELTKHFSLRLHFPIEFLRLKATGYCEIDIPEWMFDLDFPGHYMRRIRNVTLTIPCVTGPYTGVHCRLTLLSCVTRIDPRLSPPPHECCCPPSRDCCEADAKASGYRLCPDDPRAVRHYAAREAIATSSGQNDSGMFELNFHDERCLPFEYLGAISRWRIELPQENNYFDFDTLSDVVLHFNHTAREGGELLRRAASEAAQCHLPGNGWCYSDVRHEFPDAWQLFRDRSRCEEPGTLELRLGREMFPYIPGNRDLDINGLILMFETTAHCPGDCHEVELLQAERDRNDGGHDRDERLHDRDEHRRDRDEHHHHERDEHRHHERDEHRHDRDEHHHERDEHRHEGDEDHHDHDAPPLAIRCVRSCGWPKLYHGAIDVHLGRIGRDGHRLQAKFRFPADAGRIERVYVFWRYKAAARPDDRSDEDAHVIRNLTSRKIINAR
jgi:hypothetical protein